MQDDGVRIILHAIALTAPKELLLQWFLGSIQRLSGFYSYQPSIEFDSLYAVRH